MSARRRPNKRLGLERRRFRGMRPSISAPLGSGALRLAAGEYPMRRVVGLGRVVVLVMTMECAHAPARVGLVASAPCAAKFSAADSTWREVRAAGFTFCLPGTWRPVKASSDSLDSRVWKGPQGVLAWDVGRPHSIVAPDVTFTISVPVVTSSPTSPAAPPLPPSSRTSSPCAPATNTPYVIGSLSVMVSQIDCQGAWTTTALSTNPGFYIQAETHADRDVPFLTSIMETIRSRPGPSKQ